MNAFHFQVLNLDIPLQSLLQHLSEGWQTGGILTNQFIIPVPAQMRSAGETWYQGTADAIYQNINLIEQAEPHVVAIFGADHIYRMNIAHMIEAHENHQAACTIAAIPVHKRHAHEFGVIEADEHNRIIAFHEKNPNAPWWQRLSGKPILLFLRKSKQPQRFVKHSKRPTRNRPSI